MKPPFSSVLAQGIAVSDQLNARAGDDQARLLRELVRDHVFAQRVGNFGLPMHEQDFEVPRLAVPLDEFARQFLTGEMRRRGHNHDMTRGRRLAVRAVQVNVNFSLPIERAFG